jgi:hypothetical protein
MLADPATLIVWEFVNGLFFDEEFYLSQLNPQGSNQSRLLPDYPANEKASLCLGSAKDYLIALKATPTKFVELFLHAAVQQSPEALTAVY